MRAIGSFVLLLAAFSGLFALAGRAGATAPGFQKIVCIGDCVTLGRWWNEDVGKGTCWVDRFAAVEKGVTVVNAGRDGLETKHFWYIKELMKENADADAFILFVGLNDLRGMKEVEPAEAARIAGRIGYMVDLIRQKKPEAQILVIAPQRVEPARLTAKWKAESFGEHTAIMLELLNASLTKVASEKNVRFLNLAEKFPADLLPDGVHPGAEGHAKIAQLVAAELDHPEVTDSRPVYAEAKQVAPPAEGKPYANESATELVLAGIRGDLQALKGPETMPEPAPATPTAAIVTKYVSQEDTRGLLSDEGFRFGQAAGQALVAAVEKELEWQEAAGVEAVYDKLYAPDAGSTVKIAYELPVEPRADIFITQVDTPDHESYGILGGVVNWQAVENPLVYNDVDLGGKHQPNKAQKTAGAKQGEEAVAVAPRTPESAARPQARGKTGTAPAAIAMIPGKTKGRSSENLVVEAAPAGVDLPEMGDEQISQILLPAGAQVPGVPGLAAYAADLPQKNESKPQKKSLPPLAVPGYAVFVHTRPEKL